MEAIIKNLTVVVKDKLLHSVILLLDNEIQYRVPAPLFKNATTKQNFEFEILIGEKINYSCFNAGEGVETSVVDFYPDKEILFYKEIATDITNKFCLVNLCIYSDKILKSLSFEFKNDFQEFRSKNIDRKYGLVELVSTILGIEVFVREKNQEAIIILDNQEPIKVKASLLKRSSSLEPQEFEMIVGEKISYSYYLQGEIVNELEELCEHSRTLFKTFRVNYTTTAEEFRNKNNCKKYPFKEITKISKSHRKYHINLITSDKKSYDLDIHHCISNFTWEFFLLAGTYILPLDTSRKLYLNNNLLLRLPSSFFAKIKNIDKKAIDILENCYKSCVLDPPFEGRIRYTSQDFIDDALGGQADAIWNID